MFLCDKWEKTVESRESEVWARPFKWEATTDNLENLSEINIWRKD